MVWRHHCLKKSCSWIVYDDRRRTNLHHVGDKRLQCGLFGENPAEYLSFTMVISVSPRYPSHYLYSFHTCACDLCP